MTSCRDFAQEGYDAHPIHFLVKPIERSRLLEAFKIDLETKKKLEAAIKAVEAIKKVKNPNTGDQQHIISWFILMLVSFMLLCVILFKK